MGRAYSFSCRVVSLGLAGRLVVVVTCWLTLVASVVAAPPEKQLANSIGMKLTLIPAGEFLMGTTTDAIDDETKKMTKEKVTKKRAEADQQDQLLDQLEGVRELLAGQGPQHRVTLSRPFFLGTYEVTQADFNTVMGFNPSAHSATGSEKEQLAGRDTRRHPVESVTWDDAVEFCRQLSDLPAEVAAGRKYRLPTEAEWEYACRAGTTTEFYWGNRAGPEVRKQHEYAPLTEKSGKVTWPVGLKEPNPWGLHDLYGNVTEWCADWYDPKAYSTGEARDPQGPTSGNERVLRGGTVIWQAVRMRSAFRRKMPPDTLHKFRGFRVACDVRSIPIAEVAPTVSQLEAQLKQKGLVRQGNFYALAEEVEWVRYVTALERMRAACFLAQRECREAEQQLKQNEGAKAEALKARIAARTYINYSDTWREHWNGVRARHNATDMLAIADLTKEDLKKWQRDATNDLDGAVARFAKQFETLRDRLKQLQTANQKLVDDTEVQQALTALNSAARSSYKLGPSPALLAAAKKLTQEEQLLRQLQGK